MVKRSLLEAAGLDPDSELAKQSFSVIMQEIQLIKAGIKSAPPSLTKAKPLKESPAPKKDEVRAKTSTTKGKSSPELDAKLETRIQNQYQTSLTEIMGLWDESIKSQKSSLDHLCGFLNVQKYGLGEELSSYVNWATKATNEGISETEFSKEMKKRTESLQKLFDKTLSADENLAKKADTLREQIQRLSIAVKDHHMRIDELSKEIATLFEKLGGSI
ncbi:hypothetical protein EU528_08875 [Candidatus Thorarchaeota archaeon]|nr:MAG: hypothetical protein EU528_08875 [Candidatus Thorarchaeota archaeon]